MLDTVYVKDKKIILLLQVQQKYRCATQFDANKDWAIEWDIVTLFICSKTHFFRKKKEEKTFIMCVCVCVCVCKTRVVLLLHCTKMSIQKKDFWSFCVLFFLSNI
jgi:hypothetical protein